MSLSLNENKRMQSIHFIETYANRTNKERPSREILVPMTSRGLPPPTSPGRPPKDPIWPLLGLPNLTSGYVLKRRPGDVLIWSSRDVPERLTRDVHRTFSEHPLEDLESTQTWMYKIFLNFSFRPYSIDQI